MTSSSGHPVIYNPHWIDAGARRPRQVRYDQWLDKFPSQTRVLPPEPTAHAKAAGTHGTLTVTRVIRPVPRRGTVRIKCLAVSS